MAGFHALIKYPVRLAFFAALALPFAARADVSGEVSTAAKHAGLAADSTTLTTAHMHLQHVLNCLVGPDKKGFDASVGNPCKDLGSGAIAETTDVQKKELLQRSAAKASEGLQSPDLESVKKDGVAIQNALKDVK